VTSFEARVFEYDRLIFVFLVVGTTFANFVDPEQILELKEAVAVPAPGHDRRGRLSNSIAVCTADYERKSV